MRLYGKLSLGLLILQYLSTLYLFAQVIFILYFINHFFNNLDISIQATTGYITYNLTDFYFKVEQTQKVSLYIIPIIVITIFILTFQLDKNITYIPHLLFSTGSLVISTIILTVFNNRLNNFLKSNHSTDINIAINENGQTISIFELSTGVNFFEVIEEIDPVVLRVLDNNYTILNLLIPIMISGIFITFIRLNKETQFISRLQESYRPVEIEMEPEEFASILRGMMKSNYLLDVEELSDFTRTSPIFWKKHLYNLLGSEQIEGALEGNMFKLNQKQNLDEFVYSLGKTVNLNMEDHIQSAELPNIVESKRCCQLNGRLGDTYCNLCGRAIPEEYIVIQPE